MKPIVGGESRILTALMTARPETCEELAQTLRPLVMESRSQEGCIESMVGRDLDGRPVFLVYFVWRDHASLETYLESDGYAVLLGAARTLAGDAQIQFTTWDGVHLNPLHLPVVR